MIRIGDRIITCKTDEHGVAHIETDLGIVNIRTGLTDYMGRRVESIEILPDDHIKGGKKVRLQGNTNNRLVELKTVRIEKQKPE